MDKGLFATSRSWCDTDVHAPCTHPVAFQNRQAELSQCPRNGCGDALKTRKTLIGIHLKFEASRFWHIRGFVSKAAFTFPMAGVRAPPSRRARDRPRA